MLSPDNYGTKHLLRSGDQAGRIHYGQYTLTEIKMLFSSQYFP